MGVGDRVQGRVVSLDVRDEMQRNGIPCTDSVHADGKIHRFKVDGARGSKRNGWYMFVETNGKLYGRYGDWRSGAKFTVGRMDADVEAIMRPLREEISSAQERAAQAASAQWQWLNPNGDSAYLKRKGVSPLGLRFGDRFVAVPMRRGDYIVGLQRIYDNGRKLFTRGCNPVGAHHVLAYGVKFPVTAICEGYATAASVWIATGFRVVVAFTAGNLLPVAKAMTRPEETKLVLIVADDDKHTPGNPGVTYARKAAREIGAKVVVPKGMQGTDANDLHQELGVGALTEQMYATL